MHVTSLISNTVLIFFHGQGLPLLLLAPVHKSS